VIGVKIQGEYLTRNEEETAAVARTLAAGLGDGDWVLLDGPLGAGKTAFVRGMAEGLGIDPRLVHSPTFTLVSEYAGERRLAHVDLYRIGEPLEMAELGLDDLRERNVIVAVEWGEKLPADEGPVAYRVRLEVIAESERRIFVEAG